MLLLALAYIVAFAALIVAADSGYVPHFVQYLHDLPGGDKVMHFTMFGLLALAANLALASRLRSPVRAIVTGSLFVLLVATLEEYSNAFVPRRDWSLGDLTANYLGVLSLGMLPCWVLARQLGFAGRGAENDARPPHDRAAR